MNDLHKTHRPGAFRKARSRTSRGAVMMVTLWIVLGIAALALVFARTVTVELFASANQVAALQADAVAKGALQYVLAQLDGSNGAPPDPSTVPFEAISIGSGISSSNGTVSAIPTGYFWILRPPGDSETGYCFGLVDEASKLNINSATVDMLMNLPNMTSDVAASIVNWRSPPGTVAAGGAESDYYLSLPDPYSCKNSPFETVEELLLVAGVTPQLLYGDDANRNGILDAGEFNSTLGVSGSNVAIGTGSADGGWNNDVTVYSSEPASSSGRSGAGTGGGAGARQPRVGLINVNTARQVVLQCLPGLDQSDVAALIAYRSNTGADLSSIAWVAQAIPRAKATPLANLITVRSYQYSADIVAVSGNGRAYRRYRAIVNASVSPPAVVYWKDLTYLGWPLDPSILTTLRSGTGLTSATTVTTGGNAK
jgi:DNA uptake protein ComE-like DNA-binding protein